MSISTLYFSPHNSKLLQYSQGHHPNAQDTVVTLSHVSHVSHLDGDVPVQDSVELSLRVGRSWCDGAELELYERVSR